MARKKTGRPRGRPRNPNARRRQTTRAGRRGDRDRGSDRLRLMRLMATGSEELACEPLGVLLGRGLIDEPDYHAGRDVGELLETIRLGLWGNIGSAQGNWLAILSGGAIRGSSSAAMAPGVLRALRVVERLRRAIADAAMTELTFAVCAGRWHPFVIAAAGRTPLSARGLRELVMLRSGLEAVARCWSGISQRVHPLVNRTVEPAGDRRAGGEPIDLGAHLG